MESARHEDRAAEPEVESPCTGTCVLDRRGVCTDCRRTVDEIAAWCGLSAAGKRDVVAAAARRASAS